MMDIKSEKKYQTMPDLTPLEYDDLSKDIIERGLEYPIIIDDEGYIIDGYNRYQICIENGIELTDDDFMMRKGYSEEQKIELSYATNVKRRQLTMEQKKTMIIEYLKKFVEKSNYSISKLFNVSDHTVADIRKDMESRSQIANVSTVTDTKGRRQPNKKTPKTIKQEDYPNVLPNVFILYQSGKIKLRL